MNRGSRFFRFSFQQIYPDHRRLDLALASLSELQRRHRHCNMNLNPGQNPLSRLGLGSLTALSDALQDLLTVLVEVELGDDDLGGVDTEGNALAVGLLADDTLDVDNPLKTVNAGDLALTALLASTDNGDLVVLADGERADIVLLTEFLAQRGAHDDTALAGASVEVRLARLPAGRGQTVVLDSHLDRAS